MRGENVGGQKYKNTNMIQLFVIDGEERNFKSALRETATFHFSFQFFFLFFLL